MPSPEEDDLNNDTSIHKPAFSIEPNAPNFDIDATSLAEQSLLCGFGKCTPKFKFLQMFNTPKWLLFVLGTCAFVQSFVVNAIFPVGLSSIEKRFHMTSTQTGIISSWYDFAVLLAVFPVCHWGNKGHKGKWIGYGCFLMGIGSFICALPHYLVPIYQSSSSLNTSDFGQCAIRDLTGKDCSNKPYSLIDEITNDEDSNGASYLNPYFLLFILGQTFHGIGSTPLFSIGTAYIDENVSQKASPVYLAIHAVVQSIGPVVGLFVGGYFLTFYIDFDRVDMSTVPFKDNSDPRFIGAFWLGFIICGVLAIINAFPILMFPRELPQAKRHREKDVNQVHVVAEKHNKESAFDGNVKDLPKAVFNMLRNPTFIVCIVLGIFESIVINGFAAFMPKILSSILSTTPTKASYLSSVIIFAAAAGVMLGGTLIRKYNLQVGGMLKMILVCHVIALLLITSFLIQCPARQFVGITVGYHGESVKTSQDNLLDQCNGDCHCKSNWDPICHVPTGQTYFSPCKAGCESKSDDINGNTLWHNCSCIGEVKAIGDIRQGFCTNECGTSMWVFLGLLFCSVVASFASGIPSQQILLRVVPFHLRTLSIGVHWTFLRLLGFVPGGILFGVIIDTTCLKWQESSCGARQSCLVYDPERMGWTIMAVAVVCKLVSILTTIIGYLTYRPTDSDNAMSVITTDSRGPLSITVNDDRTAKELNKKAPFPEAKA
uniref:Solute carrier organic anion transporter family member n=1 Tax=Rhabditophanes sp. KR3021 TaxID=114890 RepID=A0AC35TZ74_9BILA